jgi:multiple sugar transport system permease protein
MMADVNASAKPGFLFKLRHGGGLRRSDWFWGYAFISINFLFFIVFSLGPILASLGLAFMDWRLLKPPTFVGLDNIARLLDDPLFFQTFGNTVYFVLGFVPLVTVLSFILAVLLNRKMFGIGLLRTAYFLPSMTLVMSVAMVWGWMLDPQAGVINWVLRSMHLPTPLWLADRSMAMPTLIMVAVWQQVGYYAVIYLAGLQAIPATYYEAAKMDGANAWGQLVHITIPLITPTTFFILVTSLIAGWQEFSLPMLMTNGGPANATRTILLYTYEQAFGYMRMGYASLMAWILFLVIFAVTIFQWRIMKGGEHALASQ